MRELPDLELQRTVADPSDTAPPSRRPTSLWLLAPLLAAVIATTTYIVFLREPLRPPASDAAATPHAAALAPRSLGGQAEAIRVPPLDQTDPLARTLVQALSAHAAVVAWLTTNGLIRNFAVVIANIADGASPAKSLTALRPSSPFRTIERNGNLYIDPRSYDRYSAIADAVASVDPAAAARLYATLKPRIQEAYQDLGLPGPSLDRTVERAIVALLGTPMTDGPVRLKLRGVGYAYTDDRLENLTRAQKHLLRMGPRNVGIIKESVRGIALALGIPASDLPPEGRATTSN